MDVGGTSIDVDRAPEALVRLPGNQMLARFHPARCQYVEQSVEAGDFRAKKSTYACSPLRNMLT